MKQYKPYVFTALARRFTSMNRLSLHLDVQSRDNSNPQL